MDLKLKELIHLRNLFFIKIKINHISLLKAVWLLETQARAGFRAVKPLNSSNGGLVLYYTQQNIYDFITNIKVN